MNIQTNHFAKLPTIHIEKALSYLDPKEMAVLQSVSKYTSFCAYRMPMHLLNLFKNNVDAIHVNKLPTNNLMHALSYLDIKEIAVLQSVSKYTSYCVSRMPNYLYGSLKKEISQLEEFMEDQPERTKILLFEFDCLFKRLVVNGKVNRRLEEISLFQDINISLFRDPLEAIKEIIGIESYLTSFEAESPLIAFNNVQECIKSRMGGIFLRALSEKPAFLAACEENNNNLAACEENDYNPAASEENNNKKDKFIAHFPLLRESLRHALQTHKFVNNKFGRMDEAVSDEIDSCCDWLIKKNHFGEAYQLLLQNKHILDDNLVSLHLSNISTCLARRGDYYWALKLVRKIPNELAISRVLQRISIHCINRGEIEISLSISQQIMRNGVVEIRRIPQYHAMSSLLDVGNVSRAMEVAIEMESKEAMISVIYHGAQYYRRNACAIL